MRLRVRGLIAILSNSSRTKWKLSLLIARQRPIHGSSKTGEPRLEGPPASAARIHGLRSGRRLPFSQGEFLMALTEIEPYHWVGDDSALMLLRPVGDVLRAL